MIEAPEKVREQIRQDLNSIVKTESKYKIPTPEERWDYAVERKDLANRQIGRLTGFWCANCLNRGYTTVLEKTQGIIYEIAVPCECMERRRNIQNAQSSELNNFWNDFTFAKFETKEKWQEQIKETAEEYCENIDKSKEWFFIGGQSGAGKTHICTAIAAEFIKKGKKLEYMLWRDESMHIKLDDMSGYTKSIEKFKTAEVLYIDDLFKIAPSEADKGIAFEIINYRTMKDKVTIISSEKTLNEILEIDEALGGRIKSKSKWLEIAKDLNKNFRLKGK